MKILYDYMDKIEGKPWNELNWRQKLFTILIIMITERRL